MNKYQLCPKCHGVGKIHSQNTTPLYKVCDLCDGAKMIPTNIVIQEFDGIIELFELFDIDDFDDTQLRHYVKVLRRDILELKNKKS